MGFGVRSRETWVSMAGPPDCSSKRRYVFEVPDICLWLPLLRHPVALRVAIGVGVALHQESDGPESFIEIGHRLLRGDGNGGG